MIEVNIDNVIYPFEISKIHCYNKHKLWKN